MTNRDTLRSIEAELDSLFSATRDTEDAYRALIAVTRQRLVAYSSMSAPQVAAYRQSISRLVSASELTTARLRLLHDRSLDLESS